MTFKIFIFLIIILYFVNSELSPYPACTGILNDKAVIDKPFVLQKQVANGEFYKLDFEENQIYLLSLRGSAYQMGYAQGVLFGAQIKLSCEGMLSYALDQYLNLLTDNLPFLKPFYLQLQKLFKVFLDFLLDLNYYITLKYTPSRFDEEMKGIAAGSKGLVSYELIRRLNIFPELTQAACTIVGAWDNATLDKQILQLRAFDWASNAPIVDFPTIVIYNSSEEGSNIFANIGFAGLLGSITGLSKNGITIGEKVWYPKKDAYPYPTLTYLGKPWTYVLRDLLQFGTGIQNVLTTLEQTKRTMRIEFGVSSVPDNQFRGINYAANFVQNFDDKNYTHYSQQHPQMDGVFYYDKHIQPSNDACVGQILQKNLGRITPETLFREVAGYHKTGNTQMCTMKPSTGEIWISYSELKTQKQGYERSPIYIDLKQFWENK